MTREAFSGIMLALMLIGATLTFNIHPAKASGTIYIRADGSIDPAISPIQRNGDFYTFTDNIYDYSMVIERDNIVIDGNGRTLQGTGAQWSRGMDLTERKNVTVQNTQVKSFHYDIWIDHSSGNNIIRNNITDSDMGIHLLNFSSSNHVSGNNITDDYNGVYVSRSSNNSIDENEIANNEYGIYLTGSSSNNSISGNNLASNRVVGISFFYSSSNNSVIGNNIADSYYGIYFYGSSQYNNIIGNNIKASTWCGISFLYSSSNNNVIGNNITDNYYGIHFYYSSQYNDIIGNNIKASTYWAIALERSPANRFYHNNFIDNNQLVSNYPIWVSSIWDDGYPSGGNFWSDYITRYPSAQELDDSGIWDTPYIIDRYSRDNYPLIEPWAPTPPAIMANIDIDPDTLNLGSEGKWITAYIQLPEGYNAEDIDASTITLGGTIQPVLDPSNDFVTNSSEYLVDYDSDDILERMVKFDRASIASWIYQSFWMQREVSLTIAGELTDGTPFEGTAAISVVCLGGGGGRRK